MENIHFNIVITNNKCRVYTYHPDFAEKSEWNKFGIPESSLCTVMKNITNALNVLGYGCNFQIVIPKEG